MNTTAADRTLRGSLGLRPAPAELVGVARELASVRETAAALESAQGKARLLWKGLSGGERAWLLAGLARASGRTVLWVQADTERADTAREDLELFLDHD